MSPIDPEVFAIVTGAMGVAIVALSGYVVKLHSQLSKSTSARVEDLRSHSNQAQLALGNSFKALHEAADANEHLQDAVCTLIEEVRELRPKRR